MQDLGIAAPEVVQKGDSFTNWEEQTITGVNILDELSNFIFTSKYARYNEQLKRRETWEEAVSRVEQMHLRKFSYLDRPYKDKIVWAFDMVRQKYVVPSMRSMQFGGAAVESHNSRIFNCAVRHIDSAEAFSEVFYLLLCGCGVGVGLFDRHLKNIPNLISTKAEKELVTWTVGDTIEGWADSLKVLIKSYITGNEFSNKVIKFDYSAIRKKGSPLKTGGGRAPGSAGLRHSHQQIYLLLNRMIAHGQSRIRTIDAYDILMHAADAVLSGGVRRAATSVMFDKTDTLMMKAKTGDWFTRNPQRARSNNSVLLIRDEVTKDEFKQIVEHTKEWGEPGFVFAEHIDTLFNPCYEIAFLPVTATGKCGVQFCNLTSINGTKIKTQEEFINAIEAATIIGSLQASYTNFPYLSPEAKELTEDESLLGVSITAMMDNPEVLLDPYCQKEGAKLAVSVNKLWSAVLGIKQAARVTCVKPEGTSTLVLGSMASGIHPSHAHRMFRRVQMNKLDSVYQFFKEHNPHLCEESVWSATNTDDVITFPVEIPTTAKVKNDLTAIQHLEIIKSTQENWVLTGSSEMNIKPLSHNVSCTVVCRDEEWDGVIRYLYDNKNYFSAVSLLSHTGDKTYTQVPMEAVVTHEDKQTFRFLKENYRPVDYTHLVELDDTTTVQDTVACAGGVCELGWEAPK
jgi:ribonucleoside-triphosphate reductase